MLKISMRPTICVVLVTRTADSDIYVYTEDDRQLVYLIDVNIIVNPMTFTVEKVVLDGQQATYTQWLEEETYKLPSVG